MDNLDDTACTPGIDVVDLELILPTSEDEHTMRIDMSILVARILKKHMPFFEKYGRGVERHIMHQYSEEMSQRSSVVRRHLTV